MAAFRTTFLFSIALLAGPASAQSVTPAAAGEPRLLDTVVVSGSLPAPKLWELTKGSKTLLIMASMTPTPRAMTWDSATVARGMGRAQLVLGAPGITISADTGPIAGLMLYSSFKKARQLPQGGTLRDALPPETYARWRAAKARYLPGNDEVEGMRPVYAAQALFDAAVEQVGLTNEDRVDPAIQRLASAQGIPFKKTKYFVYLKDAKKVMRQLAQAPIDDGTCMAQTLDRLQGDVQLLVARANAWAEGDVARLQSMPFHDQKTACIAAMADNDAARAQGLADPEGAARERWLRITRESLAAHDVVFAQVPIRQLEGTNGLLSALQADGYQVKSPE